MIKPINERVLVRVLRELRSMEQKVTAEHKEAVAWLAYEVEQVLIKEAEDVS